MPTESAKSTAHNPKSKKRPNKINARNRCDCESKTCRTMGNCSGGASCSLPYSNQTSNAVSWSVKKGEGMNSALGSPERRAGI